MNCRRTWVSKIKGQGCVTSVGRMEDGHIYAFKSGRCSFCGKSVELREHFRSGNLKEMYDAASSWARKGAIHRHCEAPHASS